MNLKLCIDCNVSKVLSEYPKDKSKKDGAATYCKCCSSLRSKSYYKKNRDTIKNRSKAHYVNNKDAHKRNGTAWRNVNREKHLAYRRAYNRKMHVSNQEYRINQTIRSMLARVLKATDKPKDFTTFEKIGYSSSELISRMEVQFSIGMSWSNYGEWEIDHKIPVSVMIGCGETRPERINALCNLQPIWKEDNRSKGARYVG